MLGAVGEVAGAFFALIGVLVSLYMSIRALREIQADRRLNKAPYLAFEPGGQRYPIDFTLLTEEEQREAGISTLENPSSIGLKTEGDRITYEYRGLRNYGLGPAIHARIIWIPAKVWVGTESFQIDDTKLLELKYRRELNTIPASPGHILPNQEATFFRIPSFIQLDYERKITEVEGIIEIECLDIFRQKHVTRQRFYLHTGYKDDPPYIHFTFLEIEFDSTRKQIEPTRA